MRGRILIVSAGWIIFGVLHAYEFGHISQWHRPEIVQALQMYAVVHKEPMRNYLVRKGKHIEFENNVWLVTLEKGLQAVFKPTKYAADMYAEIGAYRASCYLGFPYIPPTVLRNIDDEVGSLQLFVDTSIDLLDSDQYESVMREIDPEEHENLKIFYFVFGQWDTGPPNLLACEQNNKVHLVAIDNSGIANRQYVRYGELPFVRIAYSESLNTNDWDEPFPFHAATCITDCSREKLRAIFKNNFPDEFYEQFKSYNTDLCYVIYQNGLYRQFHSSDPLFVKSFSPSCSIKTLKILSLLTKEMLQEMFEYCDDIDLHLILERRDQILSYFRACDFLEHAL